MEKKEKEQLLKMLRENEAYKKCVDAIKSEDEKRKIKAISEDFYLKFIVGLSQFQAAVVERPEEVAEAINKVISKEQVKQ